MFHWTRCSISGTIPSMQKLPPRSVPFRRITDPPWRGVGFTVDGFRLTMNREPFTVNRQPSPSRIVRDAKSPIHCGGTQAGSAVLQRGLILLGASVISVSLIACSPRGTPFDLQPFEEPPALGSARMAADRHAEPPDHLSPGRPDTTYDLDGPFDSPLLLSVEKAVLLALRNNRGLRVEQLQPLITGTFEQLERARFDPTIEGELSFARSRRQQISPATQDIFGTVGEDVFGEVGLRQRLATGTDIGVSLTHARRDSDRVQEQHEARLGLTLTQALLRGARWDANMASIRQARLDTLASHYELRGFVQHLVADVEMTYWDFLLAQREIEIFESSLELAGLQLAETERRVEVGVMAQTELAASRAEVAQRREDLINARSVLRRAHLRLLRLMNPNTPDEWDLELTVETDADPLRNEINSPAEHVALARLMRPEINEAKLRLERGRLDVIRTRDGLLPRLDFFITLGKTGFAESFGSAWSDIDGRGYDLRTGLLFSYPLGNRAADADHERARLTRQQLAEAISNLSQLIDLDVRMAHIEVERALEQIEATRVTRELREETLRAETEKFRVGASTAFLVAQAQRDLLESRIAEIRAMVGYRQALIELYRMDGSLLLRRAIHAPGEEAISSGMTVAESLQPSAAP
jgi:outer membrane protein